MALDSTCFATGIHLKYLCCILNSNMGHYLLKNAPKTGTGDLLISVQAVEPIQIPISNYKINEFNSYCESMLVGENETIEQTINQAVYNLYVLSCEERLYIDNYVRHNLNK
jgi:hypothetical protein